MSDFGVTEAGFRLKRLEDLKAELEDDFRAEFGENVDLSADQPLGQIVAIISERRASDWLALQAVYNSFWASTATGISLDRIGELRGVKRREESYSTGFVTFTGTPEVEVPEGTRVQDATGRQLETLVSAALDATLGTAIIPVRAILAGPTFFAPGTVNTLVTSVFGVDSVTNSGEITGGLYAESHEEFRLRSASALQNPGTSTVEGIRNAVNELSFVRDTIVVENILDGVDGAGRPGHSFEVFLLSNLTGSITSYPDSQLEVAETIWDSKPGGIQTFGNISTNITDSQGYQHTVYFTEATQISVTIALTVERNLDALEGDLFPLNGETMIKDAIMAYGTTLSMGRDVWLNKIVAAATSVPGVKGVSGVTINGASANLEVAPIELPVFAPVDIEVTLT